MILILLCFFFLAGLLDLVESHARLLSPPARSSCWREFAQCPIEYTDNQMNCGGFAKQVLYYIYSTSHSKIPVNWKKKN